MTMMVQLTNKRIAHAGFSLVELMIAMVLGLFLVGGTITVFSGGIRNSEFNQSLANLQANARYALGRISDDVRLAGFQGCSGLGNASLAIRTSPTPTTNFDRSAISGAVVGSSGWAPGLPAGYTPPTGTGAPVIGTHVLMVQYALGPGASVTSSLGSSNGAITVNDAASIENVAVNDLMVISDCSSADLFKVQGISGSGTRTITPDDSLSKAYALQSGTDDTLRVMPFVTAIYYIGDTTRTNDNGDNVSSLYMQSFPFDLSNNPPIELVEGVDQMQLLFGARQTDGRVEFAMPDDAGLLPESIESVQVGLLISSFKRYEIVDEERIYTIANQPVVPSTTAGSDGARYPADKRMRIAFTKAISVRNRALGDD